MAPDDVRICIVTDIRMYREGLAEVLGPRDGITVAGTAADVPGCTDLLARGPADVVLLDVSAGSVEAIRELTAAGVLVIALGIDEVERDVLACIEAGAACYVSRDASLDSLVKAILGSARGEVSCPPAITGSLVRRLAALASPHEAPTPPPARLTKREWEIADLLEAGLSNKEIARELQIELPTVKNHVHHIIEKLGVQRRGQAAAQARRIRFLA
jgi:two-component system nitrate/nitrite response regulator NarL